MEQFITPGSLHNLQFEQQAVRHELQRRFTMKPPHLMHFAGAKWRRPSCEMIVVTGVTVFA